MSELIVSNDMDRQRLVNFVQKMPLDKAKRIRIDDYDEGRSDAQNRLLWKWNNEIQKHLADHYGQHASAEEWHDILVAKLCESEIRRVKLPTGEQYKVGRARTSKMGVKKMAEYLTKLDHYCAESLGLLLPHPDDFQYAVYGKRRVA